MKHSYDLNLNVNWYVVTKYKGLIPDKTHSHVSFPSFRNLDVVCESKHLYLYILTVVYIEIDRCKETNCTCKTEFSVVCF